MTIALRLNPWFRQGAIALIALVVLTVFLAPNTNRGGGSTYSRAPGGYGAWYTYMQAQGTPLQRWQKSNAELQELQDVEGERSPVTLVQINGRPTGYGLSLEQETWVNQGNRLIILGVPSPVTDAPFSTQQPTDAGMVKIDTGRRLEPSATNKIVLGDGFGAIGLRRAIGEGEWIVFNTPHLAANAYQDEPGNFAFLASVVAAEGESLWVDEYIHGYKDADVITAEVGQHWFDYLLSTPIRLILMQLAILLALLIWAGNRRFGFPLPLVTATSNNSRAYIEALATVLQKAESHPFVIETVGKAEQLRLQRALGMGSEPLEPAALLQAWVEQTGRPSIELERVFRPYWQPQSLNSQQLKDWISAIQHLHSTLPIS
ncbi:MAG: DUF4350 domain-containing protein [Leptolyngbyaceae cyanobacterium SL_7_1]|nr:DUF4350 domain-containing protein [Leptolyngbyaceae cyanobacterium SL_7_1]